MRVKYLVPRLENRSKPPASCPVSGGRKKAETFEFFPAPETGLAQLISLFVDGNIDDKQVPLFALGLETTIIRRAYDRILDLLDDDFEQIGDKKSFLLGLVHDWAIAHNRRKELAKVYAKGMEDAVRQAFCNHGDKKVKKTVALNEALKLMPAYYRIDPVELQSS